MTDGRQAKNPINPGEDRSTFEGQAVFWARIERILREDEANRRMDRILRMRTQLTARAAMERKPPRNHHPFWVPSGYPPCSRWRALIVVVFVFLYCWLIAAALIFGDF